MLVSTSSHVILPCEKQISQARQYLQSGQSLQSGQEHQSSMRVMRDGQEHQSSMRVMRDLITLRRFNGALTLRHSAVCSNPAVTQKSR